MADLKKTSTISWDPVADADSFEVALVANGGNLNIDPAQIVGSAAPAASNSLSGDALLTAAGSPATGPYNLQVRSLNSVGASNWSSALPVNVVPPGIPQNVVVTN